MAADFQLEISALESYLRLLKEAQDCRQIYLKAGMALPSKLVRLLGEEEDVPRQLSLKIAGPDVDPVRLQSRPAEATHNWVSIRANSAMPTTIALAILREMSEPIKAKTVSDLVTERLPNVVGGSIYNLLNRLETEGKVKGDKLGWKLIKREAAGVLSGEFLWAPIDRLTKNDLAAHRREAILHILSNEGSLQIVQIVDKLRSWSWVQAPVNKDLLKADMQVLEDAGLARRVGNSRKWQALI